MSITTTSTNCNLINTAINIISTIPLRYFNNYYYYYYYYSSSSYSSSSYYYYY